MELAGDEPRVVRQLDHLDQQVVHGLAGDDEAQILELLPIAVVELVAMAMALADHVLAVEFARQGTGLEAAFLRAEAHRAALFGGLVAFLDIAGAGLPFGNQRDHRVCAGAVVLAGVRAFETGDVAREVGHRRMHAVADAKIRHAMLARVASRRDLALEAALAETARHEDAVGVLQQLRAVAEDNCTDALANDLAYLAIVEDGKLVGYNVLVGGGLGTTPSADKTFPWLAMPLTFVSRDEVLLIGAAILKVYRDFGNRSDRKRARLKYIIHDWGMPAFRAKVEEYLGKAIADPKAVEVTEVEDHLGWNEQGDGKLWLGIPVENGRIKDDGDLRLASGLREFFSRFHTPARLTCQQSILLSDLDPSWKTEVESLLEEHGIARVEQVSTVRRWSMACPAMPTCGLAVTEAERALPGLMDELEVELAKLGLDQDRFTVRMTGCPNGCARPYNADIGLVGRSATRNADGTPGPGSYTIFLGGRAIGDRLNVEYKDYIPYDKVVGELVPVFVRFKAERNDGESFGDFCNRLGVDSLAVEAGVV